MALTREYSAELTLRDSVRTATWHDEQIDELFASLLGRSLNGPTATSNAMEVEGEAGDNGVERDEVQAGGLRIF